ncbi:rhodanese-like domain-containing protein [Maribacter ulvicola]|uniref:Rhodanese-related sulfurtransferase n=1 Tax=Maribacter ulvicola TaxID=228959 RepID=A0A1N6WBJ1_9FLAO|nr:rhodanese-like domain-containing protein [Maribacter ulvicola]SIQ87398.1 Rhodanese-related sulfurtransferase [Maribacter ulvicola]
MKILNYKLFLCAFTFLSFSQKSISQNKISKALKSWNKGTIPYVYFDNIPVTDSITFLDTREKEEFKVSHLENAIWVGYKDFDKQLVLDTITDKTQPIIVYCSIGVRSEDIGEKLSELGYTSILNLYGGIFDWKNKGGTVFNDKEMATDSVHAFSKHWGKLLHEGIKVY